MRTAAALLVLTFAAPATAGTLAAGDFHTCAVESGKVVCWGDNRQGQLGDGSQVQRALAVTVPGLTDAVSVATGKNHTCAIRKGGAVACWGDNTGGQLGDGTTTERDTPVAVAGLTDAVELAAGDAHTCARRTSGAVVCWGDNSRGQLGDGTRTTRKKPTPVVNLGKAAQISAGGHDTCARTGDGVVACWGVDTNGQTGLAPAKDKMEVFEVVTGYWDGPKGGGEIKEAVYAQTKPVGVGITDAIDLATGEHASCVVRKGGTVTCWGYDIFNLLNNKAAVPPGKLSDIAGVKDVASVAVGSSQACARGTTGSVTCWGSHKYFDFSQGERVEVFGTRGPTAVVKLADAQEVAVGGRHACVRRKSDLACWGGNELDQLGNGQIINDELGEIPNVRATAVTVGNFAACAVETSGKVACWSTDNQDGPKHVVEVPGISDAVSVAGGGSFCAVKKGGKVACWPTINDVATEVPGIDSAVQVSVNMDIACAVRTNGELWCWGEKPAARVDGLADIVQVSLANTVSCVREKSGRVQCWGDDEDGALGDGKRTSRDKPAPVNGLTDAIDLVAAGGFTCAVRASHEVMCWGDAHDGGTGNGKEVGTVKVDPLPTKVVGLTDAVSIGGDLHACVLRTGGTVSCWGANQAQQLGHGSGPDSSRPVEVVGVVGATAMAAGYLQSCVILKGGSVWCWDLINMQPNKRVELTDAPGPVVLATPAKP